MHHLEGIGQTGKTEKKKSLPKKEKFTKHKVNLMVQKELKKAMKKKKKKRTEELRAYEKKEYFWFWSGI